MLIKHNFIGVDKSQAFIDYMETKISKLSPIVDWIQVDVYKEAHKFVVALSTKHMNKDIRVDKADESVYRALDSTLDCIKGILRKNKSEVEKLRRERSEHKHYIEDEEIEE